MWSLGSSGAGQVGPGILGLCFSGTDVRHRKSLLAFNPKVACAAFTFAALRGNPQFELDGVEVRPHAGMALDGFVADAAADTNDHERVLGRKLDLVNDNRSY
jgi:hypothetical protein